MLDSLATLNDHIDNYESLINFFTRFWQVENFLINKSNFRYNNNNHTNPEHFLTEESSSFNPKLYPPPYQIDGLMVVYSNCNHVSFIHPLHNYHEFLHIIIFILLFIQYNQEEKLLILMNHSFKLVNQRKNYFIESTKAKYNFDQEHSPKAFFIKMNIFTHWHCLFIILHPGRELL